MFLITAYTSSDERAYGIAYVSGTYFNLSFFNDCKVESGITITTENYAYIKLISTSGNDITVIYRSVM